MRRLEYDDLALKQFPPEVQEAILRISRQQAEIAARKPAKYQAPRPRIVDHGPSEEEYRAMMASQTTADGAKVDIDLAEGDQPWRKP